MTHINRKKKKIAIIGGGISGLASAYFLADKYDISLYESKSFLGGHAITLEEKIKDKNNEIKNIFFDSIQ